jgi:hypothetical protein
MLDLAALRALGSAVCGVNRTRYLTIAAPNPSVAYGEVLEALVAAASGPPCGPVVRLAGVTPADNGRGCRGVPTTADRLFEHFARQEPTSAPRPLR